MSRSGASVVETGDILIKHDPGGLVGRGIRFLQWITRSRGDSKYMHSAIASSPVIEMSGEGLNENDLLTTNAACSYDVFRCRQRDLAAGAAEVGKMMMGFVNAGTGDIAYSVKGAFESLVGEEALDDENRINTILDELLAGGTESYFCSGHTVLCYVVAMEQTNLYERGSFPVARMREVFGNESTDYNPSYLHDHLRKNDHFSFVGTVKAGRRVSA